MSGTRVPFVCKVFALSRSCGVDKIVLCELVERLALVEVRQMFGPRLGVGGELVAPHERRNSNGSAFAVVDVQYGLVVHTHLLCTSSIATLLGLCTSSIATLLGLCTSSIATLLVLCTSSIATLLFFSSTRQYSQHETPRYSYS